MERPTKIKDPETLKYIEYLEGRLSVFETSPYAKTYLTIRNQIENFDEQLTLGQPEQITIDDHPVTIQKGKIDLFGSKDEKEFERSFKYMLESYSLHELLDKYRSKMTPKELEEANKIPEGASAEKHIFKEKK